MPPLGVITLLKGTIFFANPPNFHYFIVISRWFRRPAAALNEENVKILEIQVDGVDATQERK